MMLKRERVKIYSYLISYSTYSTSIENFLFDNQPGI